MKRYIFEDLVVKEGPYSHVVEVAGTVYLSGIIASDNPARKHSNSSIEQQTAACLEMIGKLLRAVELDYSQVSSVTVHLVDLNEFKAMNAVYEQYFPPGVQPVRTCVGVSSLLENARIEITCIANRQL